MINVLQVIAPISFGGAENVLLSINRLMDKSRFSPIFSVFLNPRRGENELHERLKALKCDVSIIPMNRKNQINNIFALIKIIRKKNIHVVHTHSYRSDIIGLIASIIVKKPIVTTVHGWTSENRKVMVYEYLQKKIMRYFDIVIPVSQQINDVLIQERVKRSRLRKIGNIIDFQGLSVDNDLSDLKRQYNIHGKTPVIGVIGRLRREKGHIILLRAIALLKKDYPNIKVLVIGEGDQEPDLRRFVNAEGMENIVCFCGFQKNVCRFYPLFDLFVLPSFTEGTPLVLLEAMYFKKPIIASRTGGIIDLIEHGFNGELVPPNEPAPLAESISRLLGDKSYAGKMGESGHKYLLKNFSPERWIREIEDVYQSVYEGAGSN